ncbi:MAG: acyl-CoA dehydrogenase [Alphaproteobacteria bacterium]|nr:acyl-CoA dehydrogenase [Alphaproteobacteria bacterium]
MVTIPEPEELAIVRTSIRRFLEAEVVPHRDRWRAGKCVPKEVWLKAGRAGLLGISLPEQYGGAGGDFRHEVVLIEELGRIGFADFGVSLHNAIVAPYILHYGSEEQRRRWLPKMASGELIGALAMTEPGTGSDVQAIKTAARLKGNRYSVSGQKTFITNGQNANLILIAAKTDPAQGAKGVSLLLVETDGAAGFTRGRNLDKIGFKAQDTSELFFDEVFVPAGNLLGTEANQGFVQLMQQLPQERLIIAVQAIAALEAALDHTLAYVKEREAFGRKVFEFQNTRFVLAQAATETKVTRVFVDHCIALHLDRRLDVPTAAMAKLWASDCQNRVIDQCLQLFGGYGYMAEYPIAHMWADARVQKIYGGTNEIMKEIIARSL